MKPDLLVVGSIGFDSVKTPFGSVSRGIGGSGIYASLAARFFCKPALVGCIGTDFSHAFLSQLESVGINLDGLQSSPKPSLHWHAHYGFDVNEAVTDKVELNALEDLQPRIPDSFAGIEFVFLANENPQKQKKFVEAFSKRPKRVVADTMNHWIERQPTDVLHMVLVSDLVTMNEAEARQLFKTPQLLKAAQEILKLNSEFALIKKGENGAVLFSKHGFFAVPGYPLETIKDPTGCGDSFAGALTGFLANQNDFSARTLRKAMVTASAVASFNAEDFSSKRLLEITKKDIRNRVREFREIVRF